MSEIEEKLAKMGLMRKTTAASTKKATKRKSKDAKKERW